MESGCQFENYGVIIVLDDDIVVAESQIEFKNEIKIDAY